MYYDAVALGEVLIDFTPQTGSAVPLYAQNPGGAPLNLLAQMALLGNKTAFIGKVGDDGFGAFLRGVMEERGIDTRGLSVSREAHTTLAFVQLDRRGERTFTFYRDPGADLLLTPADVDADLLRQSRLFHVGSLSMTAEPAASATRSALATARQAGCLISFDPNYRPALWRSETQAVAAMRELLPLADIVKVSQEELALLTGTEDCAAGSAALLAAGPSLVFVTLGADGAFYRCTGGCGYAAGYPAETVDTNGAGDSFFGAALSRLTGLDRGALRALPPSLAAEITRFANAAGSLTTTGYGALTALPAEEAIRRRMQP